jgi:long-chain acyl-CoA synthetase
MTSVTHGSCLVFPNDVFDAVATLRALTSENCSGFNGVPTMYVAVLQEVLNKKVKSVKIRTGITSGAPVPRHLMNDFKEILGMPDQTIIYGTLAVIYLFLLSSGAVDSHLISIQA